MGMNVGNSGSGKIGGIVGGPGTAVALGVGPCMETVTPCGMLAMRTIVGPFAGLVLAGTFINRPGSICSA
jgi:hypothetical protein